MQQSPQLSSEQLRLRVTSTASAHVSLRSEEQESALHCRKQEAGGGGGDGGAGGCIGEGSDRT